jgi:DNA-binding beta-propeller fold protein YncE
VGSSPFLAVNPKTNMVYVTNHHSDIVIDGKTNNEINSSCGCISYLSLNSKTNTVYVANRDANTISPLPETQ